MLTALSHRRLQGVHDDLVAVVKSASVRGVPFQVIEGVRSIERQRLLVAQGASRTMNSRHLTGHAVDLAVVDGGEARWDWPSYKLLASCMKAAAREIGIPIEWGGDWVTFKDGPHFQLPWKHYPAEVPT